MRLDHLLSKETRCRAEAAVSNILVDVQGLKSLLFNFEGTFLKAEYREKKIVPCEKTWGCSSAGRAPALQAGGRQFDSVHLHQDL